MKEKTTEETVPISVPRTREDAALLIATIAEEQRIIIEAELAAEREIDKVKKKAIDDTAKNRARITALYDALSAFGEEYKKSLTEDEKRKTVVLPTGRFGWRKKPAHVDVSNIEAALRSIRRRRLFRRFVRVTTTLNREAMLHAPELVQGLRGVAIVEGEDFFFVKPEETDLMIPPLP